MAQGSDHIFSAIKDIKMDESGDLVFKNGDLETVSGDEWFIQEVTKILRTSNPDWVLHPDIGAGLEDFAGRPNTRETGKAIEERLYNKIAAEGIHFPGTLLVRVVPLSRDSIMVNIDLKIRGRAISVSRDVFDLQDGIFQIHEVTRRPRKFDSNINTSLNTNPHLLKISR